MGRVLDLAPPLNRAGERPFIIKRSGAMFSGRSLQKGIRCRSKAPLKHLPSLLNNVCAPSGIDLGFSAAKGGVCSRGTEGNPIPGGKVAMATRCTD